MREIEKTDSEGNTILVENPDWVTEEGYFKKHRKKVTNFTPKKKKRKNKTMKILVERTEYEEVDIYIPFYAYSQEEGKEIFVKIDEKEFKQITINEYGRFELFKCKTHGNLAAIWSDNPSNERTWNDALLSAKKFTCEF